MDFLNCKKILYSLEPVAKLASLPKFDDFKAGSVFRKSTYPIGHRRFAKNPNPAKKARVWIRIGVLQLAH